MMVHLPTRPLLYVAGPYRADSRVLMQQRITAYQEIIGNLAMSGTVPYSPIAHWGPCAKDILPADLESSFNFWMEQDLPILAKCDAMLVCPFEGWLESRGTAREIDFAREVSVPVLQLAPEHIPFVVAPGIPPGEYRQWPMLHLAKGTFFLTY